MGRRILLIEDEPDQVKVLTTRLEANSFDVITAFDGKDGLKKTLECRPDIVLLDIIISKLSGYEVCKGIKANVCTRKIPVLVITASGDKNVEDKSIAAGADGFIKKPYNSKELLAKIHMLLKIRG